MQFNTIIFYLSLAVFIFIYFVLRNKQRKLLLLFGNLLFYLSFGVQGLVVLISILFIIYIFGIVIEKSSNNKYSLVSGIIFVLIFLVLFKYYNFFISVFYNSDNLLPVSKLSSPIGLSFYTFSSLSYLIEIYRKRIKAEKSIFSLAQFITFFPLIISGPIEKSYNLLPQFSENKEFDYERIKSGLIIITLGIFKKIVIADRLADLVNKVFNNPVEYRGIALLVGVILFSIQIYCDFSGYTDIAIGIAKILGFKISDNFNQPYYSKSIKEFWSRWHITLSIWLRDYIFLPLAYTLTRRLKNKPFIGIKAESWSYFIGIWVTMLFCGLWHGANWTFLVWGGLHAFFLSFAFATIKYRRRITKSVGIEKSTLDKYTKIFLTFIFISFAWIFFRANNLNDAGYIVMNLFSNFNTVSVMRIFSSSTNLYIVILLIIILEMIHFIQRKEGLLVFLNKRPLWQRWGIYYSFVFMILIFGKFDSATFIYTKF
jgi:alginate O-acetyltransferase complex protein AlgI